MMPHVTGNDRFLIFWILVFQDNTIVGTTDEKAELTALPTPTVKDVDWMMDEASKYLNCDRDLMRKHVQAAWTGLRPLVKDPNVS